MAAEFWAKQATICWLVADITSEDGTLTPASIDLLDRSAGRAVFFLPCMTDLSGRAPEIIKAVKEERLPRPSYMLGKDDLYRAINANEGMTLWAALKVIETVEMLGQSSNPQHRDLVSVRGTPLQFASGSIVPSWYHIEP